MLIRKEYNKLVRDNIPEIISKDGAKPVTRVLNDEEFKKELLKKLMKESQEVVEAVVDKKELIKEIGDVFEVLDSIINVFNIDAEEIKRIKQERKEKRGGFDKKIFLEYTE